MSPTQRTLKLLRENGHVCQVVERWNPYAKVRIDLFGFIDILSLNTSRGCCEAIQVTTKSNMSSRANKIMASPNLQMVKKCGLVVKVHGWYKTSRRERGVSGKTWNVKIREM